MRKMKKAFIIVLSLFVLTSAIFAKKVKRVSADEVKDLSGYWNANDLKLASEALIDSCISAEEVEEAVARFEDEYGRRPAVRIGEIKNLSSERIKTSQLATELRTAIRKSGVLDFVATASENEALREERVSQNEEGSEVSEETKVSMSNVTGAAFILSGTVDTLIEKKGKRSNRNYKIYLSLTDLATNATIWDDVYNIYKEM